MRTERLHKDIDAALTKYPTLRKVEKDGKLYVMGKLPITGPDGKVWSRFDLRIAFPDLYPLRYPRVFELGGKIPWIADRHCNKNGTLCIAVPAIEILNCKRLCGINLTWFISEKLLPHLAAQAHYIFFEKYPIDEMPHYEAGIRQAYMDICNCETWEDAKLLMKHVIERNVPKPNDLCFCGAGCKFKRCSHSRAISQLKIIGPEQLIADFQN